MAGSSVLMDDRKLRKALSTAQQALSEAQSAIEITPRPADDLASAAANLLIERDRRNDLFPPGLFGDSAWDMLLVLFRAWPEQEEKRQLEVFSEAGVPQTTGLRIIERLESAGLVTRCQGGSTQRRRSLRLTKSALQRMRSFSGVAG